MHAWRTVALFFTVLVLTGSSAAAGSIRIAVLEFTTKGGVTQDQMEALEDLLASQIRQHVSFQVIGKTDIRSAFRIEESKRTTGCNDDSCIAEVAGALGARYVVLGNVAAFDQTYLLNIKLMDAEKVYIVSSVSIHVKEGQDQLVEVMPRLVDELLAKLAPATDANGNPVLETHRSAPGAAHRLWGHVSTWTGVGCLVLGGLSAWQASEAGAAYDSDGDPADRRASRSWSGAMWAGFGAGTALVATGIVLWLLAPSDDPTRAAIAPATDGTGLVFSLEGRF